MKTSEPSTPSPRSIDWIRREFEEIRLRNPTFSLRAYAKRLGLSSGALSELLSGKRVLTMKQRLKIVERLHLTPEERQQFLTEEISPQLSAMKNVYEMLNDDQFKLIADWWHFAMLNLVNTSGFTPRLSWLARRLGLPKDVVKEGWQRLIRLGYIVKTADGKIKRKSPGLATPNDIVNISLRKSHIQDLSLIERSLVELPVDLRTTSSMTAAIRLKDLAKARALIDEFHDRFMEIVESDDGDEVYRLSISFFPLTKPEKSK